MARAARQSPTDDTFRDARQAMEYCYAKGWTDGLPVVPPLQEFVDEFLAQTDRDPDEVVMTVQHLDRTCTVRQAAINAVMAAYRPAYFPVILAAIHGISARARTLTGGVPRN